MFPPFVITILKILQFVLIILVIISAIYVKRHEKKSLAGLGLIPKALICV